MVGNQYETVMENSLVVLKERRNRDEFVNRWSGLSTEDLPSPRTAAKRS